MMADRPMPHQARAPTECNACRQPVYSHTPQTLLAGMAYHLRCFKCAICADTLHHPTNGQLCYSNLATSEIGHHDYSGGNLLCVSCLNKFVPKIQKATRSPETKSAMCQRCVACETQLKPAPGARIALTSSGNVYCQKCFGCRGCGRDLMAELVQVNINNGTLDYLELLDECYCLDCELLYRQRMHMLNVVGCGPPGGYALDKFMPKIKIRESRQKC